MTPLLAGFTKVIVADFAKVSKSNTLGIPYYLLNYFFNGIHPGMIPLMIPIVKRSSSNLNYPHGAFRNKLKIALSTSRCYNPGAMGNSLVVGRLALDQVG